MNTNNTMQDFAASYTHEDLKSLNDKNVAAGSSWPCAIRISMWVCPTTAITSACGRGR